MRPLPALTLLAVLTTAVPAAADLVPPEISECRGKKAGDACDSYTGSKGSCVEIDPRKAKTKWKDPLRCVPVLPPPGTAAPAPSASAPPSPSASATAAPSASATAAPTASATAAPSPSASATPSTSASAAPAGTGGACAVTGAAPGSGLVVLGLAALAGLLRRRSRRAAG